MKKNISGFVLVIFLFLSLEGCMVGSVVQIKHLKDEMALVKTRLDSLENKMKVIDKVFADSLKSKKP
jgi:hypothetical protein